MLTVLLLSMPAISLRKVSIRKAVKIVKIQFFLRWSSAIGSRDFYGAKVFDRRQCSCWVYFGAGKKEKHHDNIYIIDRGLQSTRTIKEFEEKDIKFIVHSKENRKFEEIESFLKPQSTVEWHSWKVIKNSKVKLYPVKDGILRYSSGLWSKSSI